MRGAGASQLRFLVLQIVAISAKSICGRRPIAAPQLNAYERSIFPSRGAFSGFIVGERTVITAAHCVPAPGGFQITADEMIVRVGMYYQLILSSDFMLHRVERIYRHGSFKEDSYQHDITLLTQRTLVEFGDFVQPICLPRDKNALQGIWFGTVSGWAMAKDDYSLYDTIMLRSATLTIVNNSRCPTSNSKLFDCVLYDGMFCGGWEIETNVCNEDRGRAFVANVNGSWTAFGNVSFTGDLKYRVSFLAGFISIPKYLDCIESIVILEALYLARREDRHPETLKIPTPRNSDRSKIFVRKTYGQAIN
uniref:Peptidase S1 domain-containing protein n=1 Tax=Anopheles christyi TaxID=43041 RepID=A0A182K4Z7_9DIPT